MKWRRWWPWKAEYEYRGWTWRKKVFFVTCGIARFARYNVMAPELSGEKGKVPYYEGTLIPTSLLVVVVLAAPFVTGDV